MSQQKIRLLWGNVKREWDIAMGATLYRNQIIAHALDQSISPHYLRHTYASSLRRQRFDLKTAQYLLGHEDIRTTANIYTHIDDRDILATRDAMYGDRKRLYRILKRRKKGDPSLTPHSEKSGQMSAKTEIQYYNFSVTKSYVKPHKTIKIRPFQGGFAWWTLTGSNRRPSARQADALPAELNVHEKG